jgi:hypothetical protein
MSFVFASEIMPASAATVTSGSRYPSEFGRQTPRVIFVSRCDQSLSAIFSV